MADKMSGNGNLFIQYEQVLICRICGKVLHRFGPAQRRVVPHGRNHLKEGKVTEKKLGWYNDRRYTTVFTLKEGIELIDRETINLTKIGVPNELRYEKEEA